MPLRPRSAFRRNSLRNEPRNAGRRPGLSEPCMSDEFFKAVPDPPPVSPGSLDQRIRPDGTLPNGQPAPRPLTAPAPATSQAARPSSGEARDGSREVVETVVFVIVLVLMLKTFIAEAFVIP